MPGRNGELPLDLETFLCFAIYSTNHAFNRIYQPLLEELGLTYPQYIAMVLLWERDGQTVGELGQRLSLESSTLTPLLKRLESLGHLTRRRSAADERQVHIFLTDSGRKLRQGAVGVPRCILDATGMDGKESKRLLTEIGALREALEKYHSTQSGGEH